MICNVTQQLLNVNDVTCSAGNILRISRFLANLSSNIVVRINVTPRSNKVDISHNFYFLAKAKMNRQMKKRKKKKQKTTTTKQQTNIS